MKKIILIPDSFKGTMSSSEICSIMASSIKKFKPETPVVSIPVADGGEGSLDAICSFLQGERIQTKAIDSCERMIETEYFYQREEE